MDRQRQEWAQLRLDVKAQRAFVEPGQRAKIWQAWLDPPQVEQPDAEPGRVILCDSARTRKNRPEFDDVLQKTLELMLAAYCSLQQVSYKQGMNEVLAPFAHFYAVGQLEQSEAFALFAAFTTRYLLALYADEDFESLQLSFSLLKGLLFYHEPSLGHRLERYDVGPELYASWWLLTLFASKTELEKLFQVWDLYIAEDDPAFFAFLSVALLRENADMLMKVEPSALPEKLSNLLVKDVRGLWHAALELRAETPDTFSQRVSGALAINKGPCDEKERVMREARMRDAHVFFCTAPEVVRHCYSNTAGAWRLVILDLRSRSDFCKGHLPMAVSVPLHGAVTKADAQSIQQELQRQLGTVPAKDSWLHVCLLSEKAAGLDAGQDPSAFELYKFLTRGLDVAHVSLCPQGFNGVSESLAPGTQDLVADGEDSSLSSWLRGAARDVGKLASQQASLLPGASQVASSVGKLLAPKMPGTLRLPLAEMEGRGWIVYKVQARRQARLLLVSPKHLVLTEPEDAAEPADRALRLVTELSRRSVSNVQRITSKKEDPAMLCFYFEEDASTPVWQLAFPEQKTAQACIATVRSHYRALKAELKGR